MALVFLQPPAFCLQQDTTTLDYPDGFSAVDLTSRTTQAQDLIDSQNGTLSFQSTITSASYKDDFYSPGVLKRRTFFDELNRKTQSIDYRKDGTTNQKFYF